MKNGVTFLTSGVYAAKSSISLAVIALAASLLFIGCSTSKETAGESVSSAESLDQESILNEYINRNLDSLEYKRPSEVRDSKYRGDVDVDSVIANMTLREKIGQLFITFATGYFKSSDDEVYRDLVEKVTDYHVGGIIFSNGNIYGQSVLTNKLQRYSSIPLWITQDMEYGAAMRVHRTTRITPAMGIAATGNPEYAYAAGIITAREARALGVHQIFAPVLDVNNNPDNPVINVRAYSGNPYMVARYGNAFIAGVEMEGVVSTAKHFPGHGDTDIDSHLSLPVIDHDYSRLDSLELIPFRAAVDNGVSSIMSAHIAFPKIGGTNGMPSTLDEQILERILIDSLNFNGLVVTDGLEMKGITSKFSPGEAVVKALKAGADLMLLSPDEFTAIHEIEMAVKKGIISEGRIEASVRKLLQWKKQHGLFEQAEVDIDQLDNKINTRIHNLVADEIARKSITVVKNTGNILPIRPHKYPKVTVLSIADDQSGFTGSHFAKQIENYHPDIRFHVLDKRTSREEKDDILKDVRESDLIIMGSFIFVRSHKKIQLTDEQISFLRKVTRDDTPAVLTAFGNPYVVRDLPDAEVHVMAWSSDRNQVENTVPALFGALHVTGKMPIGIPGMYEIGDGIEIPQVTVRFDESETVGFSPDSLRKVDRIMREAVLDSTFPGGTLTVLKDGVIAFNKGYGYQTYQKHQKVEPTDVYDLASLTKIAGTTLALMKLVDEGQLRLSEKVHAYIPEFKSGDKRKITIRHLLTHESGLPPFRIYVDSLRSRDEIIRAVKNEPLTNKPGGTYEYSDLGFILLAEIVEEVTGRRIDSYLRREFYYPMGMSSTFFNPSRLGYWMQRRIPPTEIDTVFRGDTIHAKVNDERAYFMDGVAGHAGLFSSGPDMAVFAQLLLNKGTYGGRRYISAETVERFTSLQSRKSGRGLGFDRKSAGFSTAGSLTSPNTYGHLGFTGTSLWIDPERNLAIILLTNRIYPYRSYGKNISKIRAAVSDAVVSSIVR